jgi:hypothetical protein
VTLKPRVLVRHVCALDVMKERGLLPLPAAPPSGMLGGIEMPCERARRPLTSILGTVAGRSSSGPDRPELLHGQWVW